MVIGVHTPEFAFEKERASVARKPCATKSLPEFYRQRLQDLKAAIMNTRQPLLH